VYRAQLSFDWLIPCEHFIEEMFIFSSVLQANEPRNTSPLSENLGSIFDIIWSFSIQCLRLRPKQKTFFKVAVFYAIIAVAYAATTATDCEILNSGIAAISATACCAESGITCADGRVTKMYTLFPVTYFSEKTGVAGKLPDEIGSVTELFVIRIRGITGSIPESICKLVLLTHLNLEKSSIEGEIPKCFGDLILLKYFYLGDNEDLAGELPIGICALLDLEVFSLYETSIKGFILA
jgi:hypothetical protein